VIPSSWQGREWCAPRTDASRLVPALAAAYQKVRAPKRGKGPFHVAYDIRISRRGSRSLLTPRSLPLLCRVVTSAGTGVDNSGGSVDNRWGLWTTARRLWVNVHNVGVQPGERPGRGWGLSQVPKQPPVGLLTGKTACPHGLFRMAPPVWALFHTIHTPYNDHGFSS
jgi:hypothetical protein